MDDTRWTVRSRLPFVVVILLVLSYGTTQSAGEDTQSPKTNVKTAATKADEVAGGTAAHTLCSSCLCLNTTKTIDCSGLHLFSMFANEDWTSLNATFPLEVIKFSHNGMTEVLPLPSLIIKVLDLSFNDIHTIQKRAFKELAMLEVLDLSHNRLTADALTPDVFEGNYDMDTYEPLKCLRILNLGDNNLHALNRDIFEHFPKLESLSLQSNPFKIIDQGTEAALTSALSLKFLDLSYMELKKIPEYLFHAPNRLESLNLTGNLLTEVPQALNYAVSLKSLTLDENPIERINITHFPPMVKLEVLSISFMPTLVAIGAHAFADLKALRELRCGSNPNLSEMHANAFSGPSKLNPLREEWPPMKVLYLDNNNLTELDSHLIGRWDEMEIVNIQHNPWHCSCENQWLVDTLTPLILSITPGLTNEVVCATPIEMMGQSLRELEENRSQLRCDDRYGNRPERDGAILIGILVGVLIGIPISFALVLIYNRGCFGFVRAKGPADYSRAFYKRTETQDYFNI